MERLPDPGMLPTSQEAGGMVHNPAGAMTAPGRPPGGDYGQLAYPVSSDLPPAPPSANIPVGTPTVEPRLPDVPAAPGRFPTPAADGPTWTKTSTAGAWPRG